MASRNSIIIRNESDTKAVYYVRSEPPILEDGAATTSVVWFKTDPIPCGGQCPLQVKSNPDFYVFLGHTTAPLTESSRVSLTTSYPVRLGSVANDGDSFLLDKSPKLTRRMNGDARRSTFSIVIDTDVPTRRGTNVYVLGLARAALNSTKASVPPIPVAALMVKPQTVYTFTPKSGVVIGREEIKTAGARASPPRMVTFEGFDETAVVIDRGARLFLAGNVEDGAGSGEEEVVDKSPASVPLQRVPGFSKMKSALLTAPSLTESREKDESGQDSNTAQAVKAADSDDWLARFQYLVGQSKPGLVPSERRLRVAILDSGIDLKHKDFLNEKKIKDKKSFIKNCDVQDTDGHGTHLAGLLLSLTQNVDLYIAKITGSAETIDAHKGEIEAALKWARGGDDLLPDKGWKVDMISLSLGLDKRDGGIHKQIELCNKADIIIFAATSNDGGNGPRMYPSSHDPPVLGIHAATPDGGLWPKSPNPEKIDNFLIVGDYIPSAKLGGGRTYETGTSIATVVAVAIAALMLGYIEMEIPTPDEGWSTSPKTHEGIRKIFRLMDEGGSRNKGYQWVNPIFFFEKFEYQRTKMNEDIIAVLNNYNR
jgi:hypothetical protein